MNQYFNLNRFISLLKLELYKSRRGILLTFVVTFGLHFFVGFLLSLLVEDHLTVYNHDENYAFSLMVGGFILSSLAFSDLSHPLKRPAYLLLPAAVLEKFLSMWLLTTVGWVLLYTITFTAYTWFVNGVGQAFFNGIQFEWFNPFGEVAIQTIGYYVVIQSIFLVGATQFKGYVLLKTLFVLVLLAMFAGSVAYMMLSGLPDTGEACLTDPGAFEASTVYRFWQVVKILFWWVLAPVAWLITYYGLKEKEV